MVAIPEWTCLDSYLDQFLAYLRVTKNASPNTCKSYAEDVSQFIAHSEANGAVSPGMVGSQLVRGFIGSRPELARATRARRSRYGPWRRTG